MNFAESLEKARSSDLQCALENDPTKKIKLYAESAKNYLLASELSKEIGVKVTLAYLAAFKVSEADLLKTGPTLTAPTSKGKVSNDGKVMLLGNRLLLAAHTKRINGLNKIPKPQTPLKEDIVSDILAMESKLANLGIENCNTTVTDNLMKSKHLSSDLGESFMMLSNHQYTQQKPETITQPTSRNASTSALTKENTSRPKKCSSRVAFTSECDMQLRNHPTPANVALSDSFLSYDSGEIMHQSSYEPCVKMELEGQVRGHHLDTVEWNMKSVLLSDEHSNVTGSKSLSPPHSMTTSRHHDGSSGDNGGISANKSMQSRSQSLSQLQNIQNPEESIMRLLKSVDTLHNENAHLQEENERILQDMQSFQQEYKAKFLYLKQYLQQTPHLAMVNTPNKTESASTKQNIAQNNNVMPSAREVELLQQCSHWKQSAEIWETKCRKAYEENDKKNDQLHEYLEFFAQLKKRKEQHQPSSSTTSIASSSASNQLAKPGQGKSLNGLVSRNISSGSGVSGNGIHTSQTGGGGNSTSSNSSSSSGVPHSMNMATMQAHVRQMQQQGRSSRHHTTSTLESLHKSSTNK